MLFLNPHMRPCLVTIDLRLAQVRHIEKQVDWAKRPWQLTTDNPVIASQRSADSTPGIDTIWEGLDAAEFLGARGLGLLYLMTLFLTLDPKQAPRACPSVLVARPRQCCAALKNNSSY